MRRRTFLAMLPAAAAAPALGQSGRSAGQPTEGPGQGGAPQPATPGEAPLPPRWAPGEDRFIRPDVHAGDRPVGASFASRTAA